MHGRKAICLRQFVWKNERCFEVIRTAIRKNKKSAPITLACLVLLLTAGCLQTRNSVKEQEEKQVLRSTVATLQRTSADINGRFQEVDEDIRESKGRIEVLENVFQQSQAAAEKNRLSLETKMTSNDTVYREEFAKLSAEIDSLKTMIAGLQQSAPTASRASGETTVALFAEADSSFGAKRWKDAILEFEKYRKTYPKGKQFPEATYKIGVSFQELGMLEEAKAFYDEVIAKFPKSREAGKSATRLKSLKNK
jgi:TolA-binding protein